MRRKIAYLQDSGTIGPATVKCSAINCHYLNWWNNTGGVIVSIL